MAEARRLSEAGSLGDVIAVLAAPAAAAAKAAHAGAFDADRVLHAASDAFARHGPDGQAAAVVAAQQATGATLVLLSASAMGKDLAPRVAARLSAGLASDCTQLDVEGGRVVATRPVYAGKALSRADLVARHRGDQQGRRRADLQAGELWYHRRRIRSPAGSH